MPYPLLRPPRRLVTCLGMSGLAILLALGLQRALAHEEPTNNATIRLPACTSTGPACALMEPGQVVAGLMPVIVPAARPSLSTAKDHHLFVDLPPLRNIPCQKGLADIYPCHNVDLLAFMPLAQFGDTRGNTLWGWTDPATGKEYALVGLSNGTAFVDISNPVEPRYLGKLPTRTYDSRARDIKVYQHYALVGSDFNPGHGVQVFDLTQLRTLSTTTPVTLSAIAHYDVFSNSHNLVVNEASGFLYAVGTETCAGGLHIVDIRDALHPTQAGCYTGDNYVHDAQCVLYAGPDETYRGRELCFNASVNKLTVVDVTDKAAPRRISAARWEGAGYVHQGWLTADQGYFLLNDEWDELINQHNRRTLIFDVRDLDDLRMIGGYEGDSAAVDHNLYISGTFVYEANYAAGLQILDLQHVDQAVLRQVAAFDTYPASDVTDLIGAWSPYPYFASGVVIVSTMDRGLFILRPHLQSAPFTVQTLYLPVALQGQ